MKQESSAELLDDVNRRLLVHLQQDPRLTMSALARLVGMSSPAVTERVQPWNGPGSSAVTGLMSTRPPSACRSRRGSGSDPDPALAKIADLADGLPNVSECHRITGEDCYLIKLHAATIESLAQTLDKILLYGQTVTSIVHSSPVPPRALPVPGTG